MNTLEDPATGSMVSEAELPGLMTFQRAASYLDVSLSTVRRLVDSDQLPVVPVLGAVRIPTQDVRAFINRQRTHRGERATA